MRNKAQLWEASVRDIKSNRRCREQKRTVNCVSPGLMILIFLEAWQVAGNVGCARSMVIGKCEARFKPERV